tara:strand:+ start:47503 stop:48732 length:1230 start_codon:yes stop_codon:yes gene_type:complete
METSTAHIKSILDRNLKDIPAQLAGPDRAEFISKNLPSYDPETRLELRKYVETFLNQMSILTASDIDFGGHGCAGKIWYRIHGAKKPWERGPEFSNDQYTLLILNMLSDRQIDLLVREKSLDFSYTSIENENERYRASAYFDLDHLALNMRKIEAEIRPFSGLELHPNVARQLSLNHLKFGLTLVTGITGSGKSSTLDTIIDANNQTVNAHIVIISSPLELIHHTKKCIIRHREVGRDVGSFREGIVQAMRQDPDIIVIGELRDSAAIRNALEVTDSGHKVFSTLHTASAMESIDRIIGETAQEEQERVRMRLADVLTCVISQKLVKTIDGKRVLAKEVMITTPPITAAIRNNNVSEIYQMMHEGAQYGMHTLEQDLYRLTELEKISRDEAVSQANNKSRIHQLLNKTI